MYKKNKNLFTSSFVYFLLSFYIISSWTEWWYGAAFSIRPLIATYPILGISLGYFILYLKEQNKIYKISFTVLTLFIIFLNQFQWWQLNNYILEPYRTTKAYYLATFLKTTVSEEDKKLLLVNRDFSGGKINLKIKRTTSSLSH